MELPADMFNIDSVGVRGETVRAETRAEGGAAKPRAEGGAAKPRAEGATTERQVPAASPVRIVLVMIVKNEGKIIHRVMESCLGMVSGFCICDTGSSDDTVAKVTEFSRKCGLPCVVPQHKWKNFGVNRSLSFAEGVKFCDAQGWDRKQTFGLLLDGDMILRYRSGAESEILRSISDNKGTAMMQRNGSVEYYNMRLVRFDCRWRCVGATHEFWACVGDQSKCNERLDPALMFIEDVNDGGAKADKFERDIRMLTEELRDNPTNHRTMFYLAQSYQNSGKAEEAIPFYQKRIAAGGWVEEVWYSHISIARCYLNLKKVVDAEYWYNKAIEYNPTRAEPFHELARFFRETMQPFKAWHYCERGLALNKPEEGLFVESDVYDYKLKHEMTMICWFVDPEDHSRKGIRSCLAFMGLKGVPMPLVDQCFGNMHYYIKPLKAIHPPATITPLSLPDFEGFTPSSISVMGMETNPTLLLANVRYVDYRMADRKETDGADVYLPSKPGAAVRTLNRLAWIDAFSMDVIPSSLCTQAYDANLSSLPATFSDLSATQMQWTGQGEGQPLGNPQYRMARLKVDLASNSVREMEVMHSRSDCEKNWLRVKGDGRSRRPEILYIYGWHPFEIVRVVDGGRTETVETCATPVWWKHVRGSAVGTGSPGAGRYVLTHFKYTTPQGKGIRMTYFHMLVKLGGEVGAAEMSPESYTQPFVFASHNVEFCLGFAVSASEMATFFFSSRDANPARIQVPLSAFTWIELRA